MKCNQCNDTGVIETGNNDLPCDCPMGDKASFNSGWVRGGSITGAEVKKHFLNNSPEKIEKVIHRSQLPGR
jgi:hypothetical protein